MTGIMRAFTPPKRLFAPRQAPAVTQNLLDTTREVAAIQQTVGQQAQAAAAAEAETQARGATAAETRRRRADLRNLLLNNEVGLSPTTRAPTQRTLGG